MRAPPPAARRAKSLLNPRTGRRCSPAARRPAREGPTRRRARAQVDVLYQRALFLKNVREDLAGAAALFERILEVAPHPDPPGPRPLLRHPAPMRAGARGSWTLRSRRRW